FSDGNERGGHRDNDGLPVTAGRTPLYTVHDSGSVDYDTWLKAGGVWQGGTLKGLKSKLGYLKRLGITALWVSPIFRQVAFEPTSYHGYGIQDFLDVDPHFGTREDFRDFVDAAHEHGIYVILDIIAHHTGNVFAYAADRYPVRDPERRTTILAGTASLTPCKVLTTATVAPQSPAIRPIPPGSKPPGPTAQYGRGGSKTFVF